LSVKKEKNGYNGAKLASVPERMCISCRVRNIQSSMIRLQYTDSEIVPYGFSGRSFYICLECVADEKKLHKALSRQCRTNISKEQMCKLKEIVANVR
jgi:predicted RNA-binding protein YlxR (DUF448 family)